MKFRLGIPRFARIGGYWLLWIPLFVGSINVKAASEPLMYSERYGKNQHPSLTIGRVRFSWVKFR